VVPLGSPFCRTESGEDEKQSWDEFGESGNDADDEGEEPKWDEYGESPNGGDAENDRSNDSDAQDENDYNEYYKEYPKSDTSGDESESEESFHDSSPVHISTAGIGYLYRSRHDEALQIAPGICAAVNSYGRALRSDQPPPFGVYSDPGPSSGGFGGESEGGCPLNLEGEDHDESLGETTITSHDNPNNPSYTGGMTSSGGVALPDNGTSGDESEGGVPLYDFDTVGFGQTFRDEGNTAMRDSLDQRCMGQPNSERSQDEGFSVEDAEQVGRVSEDEIGHYASTISHGTAILASLPRSPVGEPMSTVPRVPITNYSLPILYPPSCTLHVWDTRPAESSAPLPDTTAPPN